MTKLLAFILIVLVLFFLAAFDWRVIPFVIGETIIVLAAIWIGLALHRTRIVIRV